MQDYVSVWKRGDGVWCVHCETVSRWEDVKLRPVWETRHTFTGGRVDTKQERLGVDPYCPHCDAGCFDLWPVAGSVTTGEHIETASDELGAMLCGDTSDVDGEDD